MKERSTFVGPLEPSKIVMTRVAFSHSRAGTIQIASAPYSRSQLRSRPDSLFVYEDVLDHFAGPPDGDDAMIRACRGEPNAIGVATRPVRGTAPFCYLSDEDARPGAQAYTRLIHDFARIESYLQLGKTVIFPAEVFGMGASELMQRAPAYWGKLERLKLRLFHEYPVQRSDRCGFRIAS